MKQLTGKEFLIIGNWLFAYEKEKVFLPICCERINKAVFNFSFDKNGHPQ